MPIATTECWAQWVTLLPTPHRIQLPGRNHLLYGWCVPDTLFAARILGESLRVTSSCPATGQPVVLEVEPGRIRAANPPTAVMSLVTWFDPDDLRATGCGHMNLFVSADAAADFQAGYPHVVNVPIAEVFDAVTPVFDAMDSVRRSGLGRHHPTGPLLPHRVAAQGTPVDLQASPGVPIETGHIRSGGGGTHYERDHRTNERSNDDNQRER